MLANTCDCSDNGASLSDIVASATNAADQAELAQSRLLVAQARCESRENMAPLKAAADQAHTAMTMAHQQLLNALCQPSSCAWRTKMDFFAATHDATARAAELTAEARAPRIAAAIREFHDSRDAYLYGPDRNSQRARNVLLNAQQLLESCLSK